MDSLKHFAVAVLAAVGALAVFVVIAAITGMPPRISGGIALAVAIALGIKVFKWRKDGGKFRAVAGNSKAGVWMREFLSTRNGRAVAVATGLIFVWRLGYGDGSTRFEPFDGRRSWDLAYIVGKWGRSNGGERMFFDLADAIVETAIVMAAVVASALAIRWAMKGAK